MTMNVDTRAWNLVTGLALVTGCSGRTISSDGDSTDSVNDGETTVSTDGPDSGLECVDESDCPYGYYCYNGVCEYVQHHDGHIPYYDCYSDFECGSLSLCEGYYCHDVYSPPQCDFALPPGPVIEIPDQALALAFVDVDDDGAQELVVATQTQLHVYENGSLMPVSHPRGIESITVDSIVGGTFDGNPGDDVMLLHDQELDLHASDGLGTLAQALPIPAPFPSTFGIEAGEFDGEPITDLFAWGGHTSGVIYGNGELFELLGGTVTSASTRDLGLPGNGFTLLRESELLFFDIGGFIIGSVFLRGSGSLTQASVDINGEALEAGGSIIDGWTLIDVFERSSANLAARWGVLGSVTQMRAGDLDPFDETDELALIVDDAAWLHVGGECLLQVPLDFVASELAFGDHDGDGDDELAVLTSGGTISIVDVE
jgi:hypothetical protein